jgi:hypothetical protein
MCFPVAVLHGRALYSRRMGEKADRDWGNRITVPSASILGGHLDRGHGEQQPPGERSGRRAPALPRRVHCPRSQGALLDSMLRGLAWGSTDGRRWTCWPSRWLRSCRARPACGTPSVSMASAGLWPTTTQCASCLSRWLSLEGTSPAPRLMEPLSACCADPLFRWFESLFVVLVDGGTNTHRHAMRYK